MSDALVTIGTRFGLAILIFGTDIVLARLLGPSAKGRFALVLLYSQLAAVLVGWGMDSALAVVSGRDAGTARDGLRQRAHLDGGRRGLLRRSCRRRCTACRPTADPRDRWPA